MVKLWFDLEYANCHRQFRQDAEEMRPGRSRRCPHCSVTIKFVGDDGREVQRAIDDLERTLKGVSRTLGT